MYVSELYEGTVNDYEILKRVFDKSIHWFEDKEVRIDMGFQGFEKDYRCARVRIPHKRKRVTKGQSNALTVEQVAYNKEVSRERVCIEHCIGRLKQMRYIQQTIRIHRQSFLTALVWVAAALANFKLN